MHLVPLHLAVLRVLKGLGSHGSGILLNSCSLFLLRPHLIGFILLDHKTLFL